MGYKYDFLIGPIKQHIIIFKKCQTYYPMNNSIILIINSNRSHIERLSLQSAKRKITGFHNT